MRRAARVDANQVAIVKALRDIGASVCVTSSLGKGFPDIVVGLRGKNYLLEIKDPGKPPSAQKLTDLEASWHERWRGQVAVVKTVQETIFAVYGTKFNRM